MFVKVLPAAYADQEIEIQKVASEIGLAPKIRKVFKEKNEWTVLMDYIGADCSLAHIYGEEPEDIPDTVWNKIRNMIQTLYEDYEIEYVDVTPYNFLEVDDKIWMVDFGDARYAKTGIELDWYLQDFLDGKNFWNPDFR